MAIVDVFYQTPPGTPVFTDGTAFYDDNDDDMFNWFFPRVYDDSDSDDDGTSPTTSWSCFECNSRGFKGNTKSVSSPSWTRANLPGKPCSAWASATQFRSQWNERSERSERSRRIHTRSPSPVQQGGLSVRSYSGGYCGDSW